MAIDPWELSAWDAVETTHRLARREVTPLEVTEAAIARAEQMSWLNAVVTPTFERARAAAIDPHGPLAGVPFFLKDLVRQSGVRTAWGTAASGEFVAKSSDPSTRVFEKLGLVSLGKSATPEFGLTATTEPLAFGPCHNPWLKGHSTGGSSGGAASLVASGVVPIAHASDGGGSIRIPAACCGLVGLKPTRGRFDMEGSNMLPVNIAVHGVVSRTVRDTVAFWKAVETVLPSKKLPAVGAAGERPAKRLRVGWFASSPVGGVVDPELRASVEQTAALLKSLGHEVREVECPVPTQVAEDFVALWAYVAWIQPKAGLMLMGRGFEEARLEPLTRAFASRFTANKWATLTQIRRLRRWTDDFPRRFADLGIEVLLTPTLGQLPPKHGHLSTSVPIEEALARLYAFCPFTGLYNSAGTPAISLPLGRSSSGLPIGVQLGSTRGQDAVLLELAAELEAARPWAQVAPRLAA